MTSYSRKPYLISGSMVLSQIEPHWVVSNRPAIEATLRQVLGLRGEEDLIIASVTQASSGRRLSLDGAAERELQFQMVDDVKVKFGVTTSSTHVTVSCVSVTVCVVLR